MKSGLVSTATAALIASMGVGSAFWGLVFGPIVLGIDRYVRR